MRGEDERFPLSSNVVWCIKNTISIMEADEDHQLQNGIGIPGADNPPPPALNNDNTSAFLLGIRNAGPRQNGIGTQISPLSDYSKADMEEVRDGYLDTQNTKMKDYYNDGVCGRVKQCTREFIWPTNKFLPDENITLCYKQYIEAQAADNENVEGSDATVAASDTNKQGGGILGRLLLETEKVNIPQSEILLFWKVYSSVVQKHLNDLKSSYSRKIREVMVKGMLLNSDSI